MATPYHYTECGLDYVYLLDGFEVMETGHGQVTRVSDASGLDWAIAKVIIDRMRFTGREARFIRGLLDMGQAELARTSGSPIDTLERGNSEIPVTVEKDIRRLCEEKLISRTAKSTWSLIEESADRAGPCWGLYFSALARNAP